MNLTSERRHINLLLVNPLLAAARFFRRKVSLVSLWLTYGERESKQWWEFTWKKKGGSNWSRGKLQLAI